MPVAQLDSLGAPMARVDALSAMLLPKKEPALVLDALI